MTDNEATDPHIRVAEADGVMDIVIDRPDKKNALTQDMYRALAATLRRASEDLAVGAVVLSGAGGAFTAGNDLKDFMISGPSQGAAAALELLSALASTDAPLIAAVEGPAVGVGVTLLPHCDAALAAPGSRFRTPFIDLALCPEGASTLLMPARLGREMAHRMLLLGEEIDADVAAACGLVDRVAADPLREAKALAARYAEKPRQAMRASKRLIRDAQRQAVEDAIDREAAVFAERLGSTEAQATIAAFFQRK